MFFFELLGIAYVLFKLVRLFEPSQSYRFSTSRKSLALFSIITLILLLFTLAISIKVYRASLCRARLSHSQLRPRAQECHSALVTSSSGSSYRREERGSGAGGAAGEGLDRLNRSAYGRFASGNPLYRVSVCNNCKLELGRHIESRLDCAPRVALRLCFSCPSACHLPNEQRTLPARSHQRPRLLRRVACTRAASSSARS